MTQVFESPDHGDTVYVRAAGSTERVLHSTSPGRQNLVDQMREDQLWGNIRRRAKTHPGLQNELDRVIMFYQLIKDQHV